MSGNSFFERTFDHVLGPGDGGERQGPPGLILIFGLMVFGSMSCEPDEFEGGLGGMNGKVPLLVEFEFPAPDTFPRGGPGGVSSKGGPGGFGVFCPKSMSGISSVDSGPSPVPSMCGGVDSFHRDGGRGRGRGRRMLAVPTTATTTPTFSMLSSSCEGVR